MKNESLGMFLALFFAVAVRAEPNRPNILWLVIDDMGCELSCYGEDVIDTPNIDRLAREGIRFENAFLTSPVCSTARSSMITGMYQTTIGAHNHLSGRGEHRIDLPGEVVPIPVLFQQAGYTTANGNYPKKSKGLGKCDYNFEWDRSIYDGGDLAERKEGQPFFAQLQLRGGKNRHSQQWVREVAPKSLNRLTDSQQVKLPPYYPRDSVILEDWAHYLDTVRYTDKLVGEIVDQLKAEGIFEDTIIILFADNGISHARGKQFLYDEGIRTPLLIRGPGVQRGKVREDLVEHIDLGATSLALAGQQVPDWMQGDNLFAPGYHPKEAVFAARDRCGETVDMIRSVRTRKYKYIRNFFSDRPLLQPTNYKDTKPILIRLRELYVAGKLNELQEELLFAPKRPAEELYAIETDPYETVNLAADIEHQSALLNMRSRLQIWMEQTRDPGPEPAEIYAQEMQFQIERNRKNPQAHAAIQQNVELMQRWATERPYRPNLVESTDKHPDQSQQGARFVSLFDGETLQGWEGDKKLFRVEQQAIVGGNLQDQVVRNEFLTTTKKYGNFELRLQFKVLGKGANAGVQFRTQRIPNHHEVIGYQADLGDGWWGCLYDESRRKVILAGPVPENRSQPVRVNDWNDYRILCQGNRIQLWINDTQTVDYLEKDTEIAQRGVIAVQIHSGPPMEAWYRNIRIKSLD